MLKEREFGLARQFGTSGKCIKLAEKKLSEKEFKIDMDRKPGKTTFVKNLAEKKESKKPEVSFNLSEKIEDRTNWRNNSKNFILVKNIKEFIKRLKEGKIKAFIKRVNCIRNEKNPDNCSCISCVRKTFYNLFVKEINKLAGELT